MTAQSHVSHVLTLPTENSHFLYTRHTIPQKTHIFSTLDIPNTNKIKQNSGTIQRTQAWVEADPMFRWSWRARSFTAACLTLLHTPLICSARAIRATNHRCAREEPTL